MKKHYIVIILLTFLSFNLNVSAANYCVKQDESKWEYVMTTEENEKIDEVSEKELIKCCLSSEHIVMCDHYKAIINENNIKQPTANGVDYCSGLRSTFVFIGHIVRIAKILIPILIIAFGMLDFFKGVIGSKDDEIKKSIKSLIFRAISGVCIFFLPAIIDLVFSWVDGWSSNYESTYKECFQCIWNVGECIND